MLTVHAMQQGFAALTKLLLIRKGDLCEAADPNLSLT